MDGAFDFKLESVFCFHLEIKPITVGHLFVLEENGIELFTLEDRAIGELLAACLILASDYEASRKMQRSRWLSWLVLFWAWRCKKLNIGEESIRFQEFVASQFSLPHVKRSFTDNTVESSEVPLRWRLLALLMGDFSMSYTDAMRFPIRSAHCLWVAHDEREGRIKLMSEREKGLIAFAREQDAAKGLN